jgi:hypothetical protein
MKTLEECDWYEWIYNYQIAKCPACEGLGMVSHPFGDDDLICPFCENHRYFARYRRPSGIWVYDKVPKE